MKKLKGRRMLPNKDVWKKEFVNEKFHENLELFIKDQTKTTIEFGFFGFFGYKKSTPRKNVLIVDGRIHLDSFYYIDYIRKNSSSTIVDIGCGENFFSYFFDDIIGIDPYFPIRNCNYDFNEQFAINNYQIFDNAIAINSLHFIRIKEIKKRITEFASVIKPNGYGYITFNIAKMVQRADRNYIKSLEYIKEQIKLIDLNFISAEYLEDYHDEKLDGHVRLLFKK
jgi:hypothetical protein